jgi:hypothetical protein
MQSTLTTTGEALHHQTSNLQKKTYTTAFGLLNRQNPCGPSCGNTELIDASAGAADIAMAMPQDLQAALQQQPHQQMVLVRRHIVRQSSYKLAQQQPVMPPFGEEDLLLWQQFPSEQPPLSPMFEENGEELENLPDTDPFNFMDTTTKDNSSY